ncbi:hypothetical protein NC651_033088 [Populus alba x Populus x berolinensis]|nr:hypothetical protein NC651_033088 [Populus alba x Populus x berolinensis]
MDAGEDHRRKEITRKKSSYRISLSASLPEDVCGAFSGDTICAVKLSKDPFSDMRASILEMIQNVGVHDWDEMEELVYCYIALNSPDLHGIIANAFLSLSCLFS